jgi:hypothetical protein
LAWAESQETDDIVFQAKRFEDLSGSPIHADSSTYLGEFGCCLIDIDTDIRRFGQFISESHSTNTPTAKKWHEYLQVKSKKEDRSGKTNQIATRNLLGISDMSSH